MSCNRVNGVSKSGYNQLLQRKPIDIFSAFSVTQLLRIKHCSWRAQRYLCRAKTCNWGSLQQETVCQVVVRLLHEARDSGIKSSASDFHHHSLEVATLGLLSRNTKRESRTNICEKVCTLTSEKDTLNTILSVEDSNDWFHLRDMK